MRFIGYLLLILGFANIWLQASDAHIHAIKGFATGHQFTIGSENKVYSINEAVDKVERALDEMGNTFSMFFPSAFVMLVGGVLLDVASRRKAKADSDQRLPPK